MERAGPEQVRVHDLKYTFRRRLRAAGVSFEDRQDLLGHKSGRVTTHYSQAELENLIEAANKVCSEGSRKSPALVILKRKTAASVQLKSAVSQYNLWWSWTGSNRRPLECHSSALPAELQPHEPYITNTLPGVNLSDVNR